MTFADATARVVPYLHALGVEALYASPLLESGAGSNHGYDVVDPTRVSGERGGQAGRSQLIAAIRSAEMGVVLDIVPNHLGVEIVGANPWWFDVLREGPGSRYARYFDIDWDAGPLLVPILGCDSADGEPTELENLSLARCDGESRLCYYDQVFPIAEGTGGADAREVHARQHYRLVSWRRGASELTYRRFFDVSTLAAVCVEDPEVFEATHQEILRWVAQGDVDGLRVDHPDGLADPGRYLRRLRARLGPQRWLVVEKILGVGEQLPASWPVHGTTGYDALREICGVFIDPAGAGPLSELAAEHLGRPQTLHEVEHQARLEVARTILAAEIRRIAAKVPTVSLSQTGLARGGEIWQRVCEAVAHLLCGFPVYRSYLPEGRHALDVATSVARTHRPDLADILDIIYETMVADPDGELATRVQQTSGMVMAKGVEDTTFYRYNRFVALNEVGGDPSRFGVPTEEFHAACAAREAAFPHTMTTLSTHDTKRSEDVRARLAVLSEMPQRWIQQFREWARRHPLPEPSLDLLAWQNLVGAWPITAERFSAYLLKAAKEAKLATSHIEAIAEVDHAISRWAYQVMADPDTIRQIERFVTDIDTGGRSNSLGQKLLQLAGPGVPDIYQGTEIFEYSLVDPDNRRPVDWDGLRDTLHHLDTGWLPDIHDGGAMKMLLTITVLRLRRDHPDLFTGYRPLRAEGSAAPHAVAFARSPRLVVVATRLPIGLAQHGGWSDTVLPLPDGAHEWYDAVSRTSLNSSAPRLEQLLARYPIAVLVRSS